MVVLRTQRIKKKKRKKVYKFFIIFFIVVFLLLVGIFYLARIPRLNINTIEVSGDSTESILINNFINSQLEGSWFFLIPKKNIFFLHFYPLEEKIKIAFPKLETVFLKIRENKLSLDILDKEPMGLLCKEENCYFFDKEGVLFGIAPNYKGSVFVKYFKVGGEDLKIGDSFLDKDTIEKIEKFLNIFRLKKLDVFSVNFVNTKALEIIASFNVRVIFDLDQDIEKSLNYFISALRTLEKEGKTWAEIDYIDVRYENRVFFVEKNI